MNDEQTSLWLLVEMSRETLEPLACLSDQAGRQQQAFQIALANLQVDQLIAVGQAWDEAAVAAYRWDLWNAADIIAGGCSDDGFDYFIEFLIASGEAVYQAALDNPENLTQFIPVDDSDAVIGAWEGFGWAIDHAYYARTGHWRPSPLTQGMLRPSEPHGEQCAEEQFAERFPLLWAKFAE